MQSVAEVAQAVAELKNLQESHYEDSERAAEPLEVPAEILQLAEYRKRRPSDRSGAHAVNWRLPVRRGAADVVLRLAPISPS